MQVLELWRFSVKSLPGEQLGTAEIGARVAQPATVRIGDVVAPA